MGRAFKILPWRPLWPVAIRYLAAIALAAAAQAVRIPFHPPTIVPFITYAPFVVIGAIMGGLGPGLLATILCLLEAGYFALAPAGSFGIANWINWSGMGALALTGVIASVLAERLRRTGARLAETAQTARLLTSIVENSNNAIVGRNLDGTILSWNLGAERIYGYSSQEMVGRPGSLVIPPGQDDEFPELIDRLKRGQTIEHLETERATKGGQRIWVSLTVSPIRDAGGNVVGSSSIALDTTANKRVGQALRLSEDRYRSLAFATNQIVWTANPEGEMLVDIPMWREFTGQSLNEILGMGWIAAVHPEDRERTATAFLRSANGPGAYNLEYRLRRHDGEYRSMVVHGVPVLAEDGKIREWVGTCADVTDRKQAEEQVYRLNGDLEKRVIERTAEWELSNRELDTFAYSVSHDLRAPLRALDGFSRILLEEHAPELSPDARRYLDIIRKNAVQMGALIDDLLSFSRLVRQTLRKESVDMNRLVQLALEDLAPERVGRQITIVAGELPPCEADPALLKQVLLNLLSNAMKFTRCRAEGRIEVGASISPKDGTFNFFVRDNGAGFDMRYVNKLFSVFQRLHTVDEYEGTGVGLAIVQRVVARHGGRVWGEAAVDQGAAFYFTLPMGGSPIPPDAGAAEDATQIVILAGSSAAA